MHIKLTIAGRSYDQAAAAPTALTLDEGATLDDALARLQAQLDAPLPDSCLVSLGGRHLGTIGQHQAATLRDGDELILIAPVAGG